MMDTPARQLSGSVCPRLPRGVRLTHNEAQGGWVLLAPERVFKADAITVEILKRCTGEGRLMQSWMISPGPLRHRESASMRMS